MKIQHLTDLHRDINSDVEYAELKCKMVIDPNADVIVLTGDIYNNAKQTVDWIYLDFGVDLLPHQHIFYIFGNHEFYDCHIDIAKAYALSKQGLNPQITFLHRDICIKHLGYVFMGDTMWTDYEFGHDKMITMMYAKNQMSDHAYIKVTEGESFHPMDAAKYHAETIAAFNSHIANNPDDKFIVLSHHSPTPDTINSRYIGQTLNGAYASEVLERNDIFQNNVVCWFFGHMHHSYDKMFGNIRVVLNAFGYMAWYGGHLENDFFQYQKVITLPDIVPCDPI